MKVLLSSFGSAGDVRPLLGVAYALKQAGHAVVALLDPAWCEIARGAGLDARPFGDRWDSGSIANNPDWTHPRKGSVRMLQELIIPRTADLVHAAREAAADLKPDVLVGHHISFDLPWVAAEFDIPWVMCVAAPSSWPSVMDPNLYPGMPDRDRYPAWTIRVGTMVASLAIDRAIDPHLNAIRRTLGLPPQRHAMLRGQFSSSMNLGLWSRSYRPPCQDDPSPSRIVGFPGFPHAGQELPPELLAGIEEARSLERPVAVWSLGTTAVHAGSSRMEDFITASRDCGYVPIVLTGSEGAAEQARSRDGVLAFAYAPHELLFPRVDAVVHHGGIGTTAAVLRAGVPAVVVPFTHDQPDNARRLRMHGVGVTVRRRERSPDRFRADMADALRMIRSDRVRRSATEMRERIESEPWETQVIEAVESVV